MSGAKARMRIVLRVAPAIFPVVLLAAGFYAHWEYVDCRFRAVSPGRVYASARMPPETLKTVVRKYGIRSVVDLREAIDEKSLSATEDEGVALAEVGVRHHHLPTPQVPSTETVARFVEIMNDPENLPVLIHCYHGQGRAVLFSALYRIEFEGWDPDRARRATRLVLEGSNFDDNSGKGRYLIDYEPIRQTEGANGIFAQRR